MPYGDCVCGDEDTEEGDQREDGVGRDGVGVCSRAGIDFATREGPHAYGKMLGYECLDPASRLVKIRGRFVWAGTLECIGRVAVRDRVGCLWRYEEADRQSIFLVWLVVIAVAAAVVVDHGLFACFVLVTEEWVRPRFSVSLIPDSAYSAYTYVIAMTLLGTSWS